MQCSNAEYRFLIARGQAKELFLIHPRRTVLALEVLAFSIHEHRRLVENSQLFPSGLGLAQGAAVATGNPRVVLRGPCAVGHASGHRQEAIGLPLVIRCGRRVHARRCPRNAVHCPQDDHVLEFFAQQLPHASEIGEGGRVFWLIAMAGLVQTLALVAAVPEQRLVPDRRCLLGVAHQDSVLASKRGGALGEALAHLVHDLAEHLSANHAELVNDENPGAA